MSDCPECHETIVIGRACGCAIRSRVEFVDATAAIFHNQIAALEARNAATNELLDYEKGVADALSKTAENLAQRSAELTARCARLAAALEEITHGSPYSVKSRDGEYFKQAARTALTADDAKMAEQWRAMEAVVGAAIDKRLLDHKYNEAQKEDRAEIVHDVMEAEKKLAQAVDKLAAVEASKEE